MRIAGIDIGTNTLRLLIVESTECAWKEISSDRKMTRLGEGFSKNQKLTPSAIQRTLEALKSFYRAIQQFYCDEVLCVATSAVREARNQNEFLSLAKKEIPFKIRVISGEEEARLTWLGVCHSFSPSTDYQIMIDIGGGSTEWILANRENILDKISLPIGAVSLTEQFLFSDPPDLNELNHMKNNIRISLARVKESFLKILNPLPSMARITWVGTAGTVTTLSAMAQKLDQYSFEKVNGFVLTQSAVEGLYQIIVSKRKEERIGLKGLETGREDIILAGTVILLETMLYFDFNQIQVSDYGLREGIIIDRLLQRDRS